MAICSVLRCPETATASFRLGQGLRWEAPVCEGHYAALKRGVRWMLHEGVGVQDTGGERPEDLRIVMGEDLPPNQLVGFGVGQTIGDEPGFTISIDVETPEGRQQVSFWTTTDVGNRLGSFLVKPPPAP